MRYRFTMQELEQLNIFLTEAFNQLQSMERRLSLLKSTPVHPLVDIREIFYQLKMLKTKVLLFGLMEMAMLIRHTELMLEAMYTGRLQISDVMVELLFDSNNLLKEMILELDQASKGHQHSEVLEVKLACAQESEWLITFLQQLLQQKSNKAIMSGMRAAVSNLPAAEEVVVDNSVTVSDEKMDRLLTRVGELTVTLNVFSQLARRLRLEYNLPTLAREVKAEGEVVNQIAVELEETLLSMRIHELRRLFVQIPPIIHDIARRTGKNIILTIEGENIEIDKTIAKQLYEPLLKVICTIAEFGIEVPSERALAGKARQGHIQIRAYNLGKEVVIEVEDDGSGMRGGDIGHTAWGEFDFESIMSEVRGQINVLQGDITVASQPGKGSTTTIRIPHFGIRSRGLLVEVADQLLILLLDNVVEVVKVATDQLASRWGRKILDYRNEALGVVVMAELLGMGARPTGDCMPVVVVADGQARIGMIVDKVIGEQDILIKALPDYLNNSSSIRGAAIIGAGKVALVVNVLGLIKAVGQYKSYQHYK